MRGSVRVRVAQGDGDGIGAHERLAQLIQTVLLLAGLTLVMVVRAGVFPERALLAGAKATAPGDLKDGAAVLLEQALATGGTGIRFEIVQFQTMKARPGGRQIEIPHPVDRTKTIGLTDEYFLSSLEQRGITTADGFWSEMRAGPPPDAEPNWNSDLLFQALETGGKTWRDDTHGWYLTDSPPGIGLDPKTVRLLPSMLRNATLPMSAAPERVGDTTMTAITAVGKVADIPGVVAADGAKFTKLHGPITLAFDTTGRLAKIRVSALNTNMAAFDLVVETTIVIFYDNVGSVPQPKPVFADSGAGVEP